MNVVVMIEEHVAERAGVLNAAEAFGERGVVLERLERRLRKWVVV
jgi:hypothetical protein